MRVLKSLRVRLDGLVLLTSPISTKTTNKLEYAKMWTGKLLGSLNQPSPYKNDGKRHNVSDIEPRGAQYENASFISHFHKFNLIEKVDKLREMITEEINFVEQLSLNKLTTDNISREANICRTQIWVYLTEARLELGLMLGKIRDEHKNES